MRRCYRCKVEKPDEEFAAKKQSKDGLQSYCKLCVKTYRSIYNKEHHDRNAAYMSAYYKDNKRRLAAYQVGYRKIKPGKSSEGYRRYKARKLGNGVVPYKNDDVYERDGWICQICFLPINRSLKWPDPMSKSIDHVLRVMAGRGPDTIDNVRASHLKCNQRRPKK